MSTLSDFHSLQRQTKLEQKEALIAEYTAVQRQISHTLDEGQRVRLHRRAATLEDEIRGLEAELAQLPGGETAVSPTPVSSAPATLPLLVQKIYETFSLAELQDLCFRLGVDYEDLGGVGRQGKVRELVLYLQRRQRLADLVAALHPLRPAVEWDKLLRSS